MYDGVIKFGGVDMIFSDSQFKYNGIICLFPIYEYSNIIMLDEHLGDLSIVVYNYCISDAGGGFGSYSVEHKDSHIKEIIINDDTISVYFQVELDIDKCREIKLKKILN